MLKQCTFKTIILAIGFSLLPTNRVGAQTFTVLHSFSERSSHDASNSDGSYPVGKLTADSSGNTLYGTANQGGSSGYGTVFAINSDGTGFTNLHSFVNYTNGTQPMAGVILSGNTLYGAAWHGGASAKGAVFALNTDGSEFKTIHSFTATVGYEPFARNSDGAHPVAGLILSGNRLYGTAEYGGSGGNGTVFALNTDGTGFRTVHSFPAGAPESAFGNYTNIGGIRPNGGVILSGDTLYGTAVGGGKFARGTVFKVNTNGSGFTTLHNFTRADFHPDLNPFSANSDGTHPMAGLVLSNDTLYGTTQGGGDFGQGTVFKVNTDGTGFTTLHSFRSSTDGYYANATLILSGNTLYGAAIGGGTFGGGTVFALNTDGTGFTALHHFKGEIDGRRPDTLVLLGNSLYGVARTDGNFNNGTMFRLSFAPQLNIYSSEANVTLTWPTNVAGFDYTRFTLQTTTNLLLPTSWSPVAQPAGTNGDQISVSVPASEGNEFFQLKAP